MMVTKRQTHRTYDEVTRQILNFLSENGPASILQIEYAVEINTRQTKSLLPLLIAANIVVELLPHQQGFKKLRVSNVVARLFRITAKGRKCMDLMNKIAQHLNTPVVVQYNIRRAGYFLPNPDGKI